LAERHERLTIPGRGAGSSSRSVEVVHVRTRCIRATGPDASDGPTGSCRLLGRWVPCHARNTPDFGRSGPG
jgi:hypothetical protein